MAKFKVGDKAYKPNGYKFPCTIVSVFTTTSGETRIVAEMDEYNMLHIFNETQLEPIAANPSTGVCSEPLTLEQRENYWFNNMKPNSDIVEQFDTFSASSRKTYLDKLNVPESIYKYIHELREKYENE